MASEELGPGLFNPFKAEFSQNPYPTYKALREHSPLFSVPGCQGNDWIVTSFELAQAVLTDQRFQVDDLPQRVRHMASAANVEASVETLCETLSTWLFFVNEPEHGLLRRVLASCFSQDAIRPLRSEVMVIVRDLVQKAIAGGHFDVIEHLARPLPARVAASMFNFGSNDFGELTLLSAQIFGLFTQPLPLCRYQAIDAALRKMSTYLEACFALQRRRPTSALAAAVLKEMDSGGLSAAQAYALCTMIFSVGQDTVQNLIGNAIQALLDHPTHLAAIRHDTATLPAAIREVARFDSPVQLVLRIAAEKLELSGRMIERNERIHVYLGAALRDPAVFPDPDVLTFSRPFRGSLPFGAGIHFCLGFHLAQLEAEAVLEVMAEYLPMLRLENAKACWIRSVYMRGLQVLPVLVTHSTMVST